GIVLKKKQLTTIADDCQRRAVALPCLKRGRRGQLVHPVQVANSQRTGERLFDHLLRRTSDKRSDGLRLVRQQDIALECAGRIGLDDLQDVIASRGWKDAEEENACQ